MAKVSVIVPVYNVAYYLRECMDSLVGQTLRDIEIICVDDGSSDSSYEILMEYAAHDSRIKVIRKENSGYGNTVNIGMDVAAGQYIGIVESDDYVHRDMYRTLYLAARQDDLDFVKSDFCCFYGSTDNRRYECVHAKKNAACYGKILNPAEHMELFRMTISTWAGIYKREFLECNRIRHNETPGASYQDNGFWFQTLCLAKRVLFVDKAFYMYRCDNPGSSVHSRDKVYSICREYDFIYEFLERNPELKKRFLCVYYLKKYHSYQYTLDRIGREYREEFLVNYSREFRKAQANGELSRVYFKKHEWSVLRQIMNNPKRYGKTYRWKGNICYKISYYMDNYGIKKTFLKIAKKMCV